MQYKILTSGKIGEDFTKFANNFSDISCTYIKDPEEITQRISEFNALAGFIFYSHLDISHIKWIHSFGAGVESIINHPHFNRKKTALTRTVGRMGNKMGEYCLAYAFYILKNIEGLRLNQVKNEWKQLPSHNLSDKNIIIFGTGEIGSGVAKTFNPLSNKVVGVNTSGTSAKGFDQVVTPEQVKMLDKIDVIINTLPLTKETLEFYDISLFKNFKGAIFINVGRGGSVVHDDLIKALGNNYISKAVLDVFEDEPLPANSILWKHPDIIITPHQAALTDFEDIKISFNKVYEALKQGKSNDMFVDLTRSY
ncbi:MAG: NAD(P)-dependent oxidoreductase [Candidatus Cyclobacteriaceae bacterium M2_1C_046]